MILQPDGKILYPGETLFRLNSDGTLDSGFSSGVGGYVYAMVRQPDGKLIVGGYLYNNQNGAYNYELVRINADGSPDNSFEASPEGIINSVVLQPDGKVLIGGGFIKVDGTNRSIARLNANGTVDATFAAVAADIAGAVTGTGSINAILLQAEGKVVIGGQFVSINGNVRTNLARLNADGSIDLTFPNDARGVSGEPLSYPGTSVKTMALQTNGAVLIGGAFTTVNGTNRNRIARLNADGRLDAGFDPGKGIDSAISSLAVQPDGKVLIAGSGYQTRVGIGRLQANGSPDSSFDPGTGANSDIVSVALQPDGKVLIGGSFTSVNGVNRLAVARLNSDGTLDENFQPQVLGLVAYDPIPHPYGGGHSTSVTSIVLQEDGKVLVAGYHLTVITGDEVFVTGIRYFVVRFLANGIPDPAFASFVGEGADGAPYAFYSWVSYPRSALALQADGKILLSGDFHTVNDTNLTGIARLNADGTRDNAYTPDIGMYAKVTSLALQPDQKLLMAGSFGIVSGTNRTGIWRLQADGNLDTSFAPVMGPNASVSSFALQPDGKVVVGGSFTNIHGTNLTAFARLNPDGSADSSFNPGTAPGIRTLALQPDGGVLIGGGFLTVNGVLRPHVARLYGDSFVMPSLRLTLSNAFTIVSWPATTLNLQLQESTNLALANAWSGTAVPAVTNSGQILVTLPTTTGSKFFRLRSQ